MRPGQNKRMRGRNNNGGGNRKGPNPLTRSYESNGPDVKIRGTAHHIAEKYLQLARDAQSSGDPVMAESYLQHAEHYFRLIATAQQAQQQAAFGYQRSPSEQAELDADEEDDEFGNLPDRFSSPPERVQPQPQSYGDRQPYTNGGDRQGYDNRGDRQPYQDRQQGDRQDNRQENRQENRQDNRQDQPRYDNRDQRQDRRPPYGERQPYANGGERNGQQGDRGQDRNGGRDFDNRNRNRGQREYRNDYQPRENRDNGPREPREAREPRQQPEIEGSGVSALPAFITAPMRPQPDAAVSEAPMVENETSAPDSASEDAVNFAMRPRRRRRPKAEFADAAGETAAPAADPVGE
jgi:hypothetical protein